MPTEAECSTIEEVRQKIDQIDRQIVALIAERGGYVKQAVQFKKTANDVRAPQRGEEVICKVKALATEFGADLRVTEEVYRAMIHGFIDAEMTELAAHSGSVSGKG
jgi:isochorismate pyruvate lyase